MPLTGSAPVLSAAIRAALIADPRTGAVDDSALPTSQKALTAFCDVIAQTVLAHVVANAVVTVPPGVLVVVAVPAGTGATTAPGVGTVT